jgi:hypothetical protein
MATKMNSKDEHAFVVNISSLITTDTKYTGQVLDSGASSHFKPNPQNFTTFQDITPWPIKVADGCTFHATGQGDVVFSIQGSGKMHKITLHDMLYVLSMPISLISISPITRSGY